MALSLAALVFLIIILIWLGISVFAGTPNQGEVIRGRLEAIEKGAGVAKSALDLNLIRDELLSGIPTLNKMLVRWSWPRRLRNYIAQAGVEIRPGKLVLFSAGIGLAALEVVQILYGNIWMSIAVGVAVAFLPLAVIAIMRARRLAAFQKGFPEVIDLLGRSVRAGHSFAAGLEIVATDLGEPVATEFRITFDEQRFGLPLRDALLSLSQRVPLMDVRIFVIALLVQKDTGGNLAEILDNLAHVIRERFRIAGEVRVRTAQGRLTAVLLMALPLVMMVMLHFLDPEYIKLLFTDHLGKIMLIVAAAMQILGAFIIWRIVQIKV
ncbi:MAG: type II secretion system F family protein [Terriglobia bacterium]